MGFLDSLKSLFGRGQRPQETGYWIYVRCRRCGEIIKTRLDLTSALNPRDEGGYMLRKTLVGNQRCFERIEVTLFFDENRQLVDQTIERGEFVTVAAADAP